jgi:hypothetical protein
MQALFFSAFFTLAIDDGGGGTGLPFSVLPTFHIKRMVDAIQRAVIAPQVEIIKKRAAWRQVFRHCPPLASRAQDVMRKSREVLRLTHELGLVAPRVADKIKSLIRCEWSVSSIGLVLQQEGRVRHVVLS